MVMKLSDRLTHANNSGLTKHFLGLREPLLLIEIVNCRNFRDILRDVLNQRIERNSSDDTIQEVYRREALQLRECLDELFPGEEGNDTKESALLAG